MFEFERLNSDRTTQKVPRRANLISIIVNNEKSTSKRKSKSYTFLQPPQKQITLQTKVASSYKIK
jgi:hypothetical protein